MCDTVRSICHGLHSVLRSLYILVGCFYCVACSTFHFGFLMPFDISLESGKCSQNSIWYHTEFHHSDGWLWPVCTKPLTEPWETTALPSNPVFSPFPGCHVDGKLQHGALGLWRLCLRDRGGMRPWPSGIRGAVLTAESCPWWEQTAELSSALLQRAAQLSPVWRSYEVMIWTYHMKFISVHISYEVDMNICKQIFVETRVLHSLRYSSRDGFLSRVVNACFSPGEAANCPPGWPFCPCRAALREGEFSWLLTRVVLPL